MSGSDHLALAVVLAEVLFFVAASSAATSPGLVGLPGAKFIVRALPPRVESI